MENISDVGNEKLSNREEKTQKRIQRSIRRRKHRMEAYVKRIEGARVYGSNVPLYATRHDGSIIHGSCWFDKDSPTKWTQICSHDAYGTCQFPCNGDC
jgi:hypothetical protein